MVVLSLFDLSGNMVRPWAEAGHDCFIVDIAHRTGFHKSDGIWKVGMDINDWNLDMGFDVAFAFPPCTHLAGSGARWWKEKGPDALEEGLQLVSRGWSIIQKANGPYMLENPVGRLSTYWRKPDCYFHPYQYGGYLPEEGDRYTKKTCLWVGNNFVLPPQKPVVPDAKSYIHHLPPSKDRATLRSVTPMGFARAVFEYNQGWEAAAAINVTEWVGEKVVAYVE